jgi:hypothetical protein
VTAQLGHVCIAGHGQEVLSFAEKVISKRRVNSGALWGCALPRSQQALHVNNGLLVRPKLQC